MTRCKTAACCRDIFLTEGNLDILTSSTDITEDREYILDMLELVHFKEDGGAVFQCRHLKGNDCSAYEQRPLMCKNYPYRKPCTQAGCTRTES